MTEAIGTVFVVLALVAVALVIKDRVKQAKQSRSGGKATRPGTKPK